MTSVYDHHLLPTYDTNISLCVCVHESVAASLHAKRVMVVYLLMSFNPILPLSFLNVMQQTVKGHLTICQTNASMRVLDKCRNEKFCTDLNYYREIENSSHTLSWNLIWVTLLLSCFGRVKHVYTLGGSE